MAKNYNWKIKREYYNLIDSGVKSLEVRVGYPSIKKVCEGDTVTFINHSNIKYEIIRIARYENFPDMLDNEDFSKAIPGVTKSKALEMYRSIYPNEKESLGVYVFELQIQINEIQFCNLSSLIINRKRFIQLAQDAYSVTDFICKDYPKHFEWYWSKEIPRVFNGTGEIVICTIDDNIAGVAFLKKDVTESKICTFFVVERYRGKHIATKILEFSFKYLGTTKPLITIADYKIPMFEHIIKKYDWKLMQTMDKGYYNASSREFVYNGELPK